MALVNMQKWLAEHGGGSPVGAVIERGEAPAVSESDQLLAHVRQLEATIEYQTDLITKLQTILRSYQAREAAASRAAQPSPAARPPRRSLVIRKPRALPERK